MDKIRAEMLRDSLQGIEVGGWLISGFHGNGKSAVVLAAQKDGTVGAIKVFHPELVERYGKAAQLGGLAERRANWRISCEFGTDSRRRRMRYYWLPIRSNGESSLQKLA